MNRQYNLAIVHTCETIPKNKYIKNLFSSEVHKVKSHLELPLANNNLVSTGGLHLGDMVFFSIFALCVTRISMGRYKTLPNKLKHIVENQSSFIDSQSTINQSSIIGVEAPLTPEILQVRRYWLPSPALLTLISGLSFWGISLYFLWILLKYLTTPFRKVLDLISVIGNKSYTLLKQSIPSESLEVISTASGKTLRAAVKISSFISQPDLVIETTRKNYAQKLEDKASIEEFMLSVVALQTIAGIYNINLSPNNNGSFFIDSLDNLFVDLESHKIVESSLAAQIIKKLDLASTTSTQELFQYLKSILKLDFLPVAEALNTDDEIRIQTEKMRIYSLVKGFKKTANELVAPPQTLVRLRKTIEHTTMLDNKIASLILLPFVLAFVYKYQVENPITIYVRSKLGYRIPHGKRFLNIIGKMAKPFNGDPQTLNPLIRSFKERIVCFLSGGNSQTKFVLTRILPCNLVELIELPFILMYIPKLIRAFSHGTIMGMIYIEYLIREHNKSRSPMHQEAKNLWEKAKKHSANDTWSK